MAVRVNVAQHPEFFDRFGALWTPTVLVLDHKGVEAYRVEGFLPAEDLLQDLELGLGRSAFSEKEWSEAQRHYDNVLKMFPHGHAAPEALYWSGVARYKATGEPKHLSQTAEQFKTRYSDSVWAKKAGAWAAH